MKQIMQQILFEYLKENDLDKRYFGIYIFNPPDLITKKNGGRRIENIFFFVLSYFQQ